MNVLIAGMPRSASTALFNVVRYIFEYNNIEYCSGFVGYVNDKDYKDFNVFKAHEYDEKYHGISDYIILPQRDIRDVIASYNKYRPNNGTKPVILAERFIEWNDKWEEYADIIIEYNDFIENTEKIIEKISMDIGFDVNGTEIIKKVNDTYEKVKQKELIAGGDSLFWRNHITDGSVGYYKSKLPNKDIDEINNKYKDWLIKHNYKI